MCVSVGYVPRYKIVLRSVFAWMYMCVCVCASMRDDDDEDD